jgi:DNA-3-methyladenine glycosylase
LTNGPGKLAQALVITGAQYGADPCGDVLFLEDTGYRPVIARSPRINVGYADDWALKPWRFYERDNRYVSR